MVIVRGQIFWCGLDPVPGHEQGALRPVIIISADAYNLSRSPRACQLICVNASHCFACHG